MNFQKRMPALAALALSGTSFIATLSSAGVCPGRGDCFSSNGSPGCNDTSCCNAVCSIDDFCCSVTWDSICADEASTLCIGCGQPGSGSCFESDGTPGCDDAACCNAVCAIDGFCCSTSWDSLCVGEAEDLCTCGGSDTGSCFSSNGTPYCNDTACCSIVCAIDSYCCSVSWDSICANEANDFCLGCGGVSAGDCFVSNGTVGCNDESCCNAVCAVDDFCCDTSWDSICADEAQSLCVGCGAEGSGSCFQSDATPGCDNAECCNAVCNVDGWCCSVSWDSICVNEAEDICLTCGGAGSGSCFSDDETPGCNDASCCNAVCDADEFCCSVTWDSICADEAMDLCIGCGAPGSGPCGMANGTPGCKNANCCNLVCSVDPFCCNTLWDGICANEAQQMCACPEDLNGDNLVNGADLGLLLADWNAGGGSPADLNGDNAVNGADLGLLLAAWGPCFPM